MSGELYEGVRELSCANRHFSGELRIGTYVIRIRRKSPVFQAFTVKRIPGHPQQYLWIAYVVGIFLVKRLLSNNRRR